jgi:DHA2 family multidrug resistance protein
MGTIDTRIIIATGLALTGFSLWQTTEFYLQIDTATVVWSGIAQRVGTGFVFVPVSAAAFATLIPALRNEGSAIFSLARNLGSSVGIAVVEVLLTRSTEIVHSTLGENVSSYNEVLRAQMPTGHVPSRIWAELNATVTEQASIVACVNDFKMMMVLSLAVIPLVLLLRKGRRAAEPVHIE